MPENVPEAKVKLKPSKRRNLTIVVSILWVVFGVLAFIKDVSFNNLAAYYVSLTGFVGAYMWSETTKQSKDKTKFGVPQSYREKLIYMVVAAWTILGVFGIYYGADITGLAAYFGSFTPFMGSYIISITKKSEAD